MTEKYFCGNTCYKPQAMLEKHKIVLRAIDSLMAYGKTLLKLKTFTPFMPLLIKTNSIKTSSLRLLL